MSTNLLYKSPPPGYPKQYRVDSGKESAVPVALRRQPSNIGMVCGSGEESAVLSASYTGLPTVSSDSGEETAAALMAGCFQNTTYWIHVDTNSDMPFTFNGTGARPVAEIDSIAMMSQ